MKLLSIVFARTDVNSFRSVNSFHVSGREYFKKVQLDVEMTNEIIGVRLSKGIMDTTFHTDYNVRALNDLEYILKMYHNFKIGNNLLDGMNINFMDTIKYIEQKYDQELPYDYLGISSYDRFILYELYTLFTIKRKNPKIKTIIGGNLVNHSHEISNFLAELDGVDYVLSGDFENSIEKLLTGKLNEGTTVVEPMDLSELAPPIYTLEDSIKAEGYITLTPSRNCPFRCSFCSTAGLRNFRYVPTDQFTEWVRLNNEAGVSHSIAFNAPTTNWSKKQFEKMLDGLIDIKNKLRICGWFRLENLDENLITKMKKAGVIVIWAGIDALDNSLRKKIDKGNITFEQTLHNLTLLDRHGIRVSAAFIRYIPGMTQKEHQMELLYYKSMIKRFPRIRFTNFHYIMMAGSPMETDAEKYGMRVKYWENPNPNLPELDEVVSKIKQSYEYDISHIKQYEEFGNNNDLKVEFEELRSGYIPDTEMGRRYEILLHRSGKI